MNSCGSRMSVEVAPWMDKAKLEKWLEAPVTECVKKEYEGKGDNFMSTMHRVLVKTESGERSLIVKCRMGQGTAADVLRESTMFKKEIKMYGTTLPRMEQLLKNAINRPMEPLGPKCLYSCKNFLVMEDLSADGYKMLNRREGLSLEQALTAMRAIARFHAASVAIHEEDPESMKDYDMNFFSDPTSRHGWIVCFRAMAKMFLEEFETWPKEIWSRYLGKIRDIKDDFLDRLNKATQICDTDFNVLSHGDLWINNLLYKSDDVTRIIDFQFVQFSSFAIDLHLLITTSLKMEVRESHLDSLIKLYDEYRRKSFYGVFGVIMAASVMTADLNCGFDLDEAMKGIVPGPKMYSEYYKKLVKFHLPLLDEMEMAAEVPAWLDISKLQQWLGTPVTECVSSSNLRKGDSNLCDIERIVAKTKDGDKALVLKFRKTEETAADFFKESALFKKEEDMYGVTLPKLENILSRVMPKETARLAPKCWHSCNDYLVLEDLSADGFKMQNRLVGMNLEQSLSVMRNIGKFHAASIALQEEDPESMNRYDINFFAEPSTQEGWNNLFIAMAKMLIEELESWPEEWSPYLQKIKVMRDGILKRMNKVTKRVDADFNVLAHGDLWGNNVLFQNNDVIRFIDFQLEYHSSLTSTMSLLGCKRRLPTLSEIYDEFERKAMYGVFAIISPAGMMTSDPAGGFDFFEAMRGKTPGPKMYSDFYRQAVKFHLPLLDKMDYVRTDAELKGDNYLSDLHRLLVKTKDGDKALIVKCRLEDGVAATALKETAIFTKEEKMYGHTLPKMDEFIEAVVPEEVEPLAPKCYYSCESFLVMEDLASSGYRMMNRREGLNLEQCLSIMRTIARFHASSVALVEENPDSMKGYELHFFDETSTEEGWRKFFPAMTDMLIDELKTWPQEWSKYIEKLRPLKEDFLDRLRKVTRPEESNYKVLVHGDLWTNNMLFRGNDVRLLDFQLVQYTSLALDLHLFLTTSPNAEVREHHIDRLIKEYHTTLNSMLTALDCSRRLLTMDELLEEYKRTSLYGIFAIVSECAIMLSDPNSGFDLDEAMKGNTPGRQMYDAFFKQIVKRNFPILDSMGAFEYK
ncbi:hypothetical protein C0J52_09362 [Blattella germanica]|nr:hypothetical protein C0J52_09362 [Blattella germanica]